MNKKILTLSFIEGGLVMVAELCAAKMLAPFYGTSIQVWAAILAVTLGGLSIGYFVGAILSKKDTSSCMIYLKWLLTLAAALMILITFISTPVMLTFLALPLSLGSILSLIFLLLPILVSFGASSPLIINILGSPANNPGNIAGTVYSISTVGGIIFTLLTGFYFIPEVGIRMTMIIMGLGLGIITNLFIYTKNMTSVANILLFIVTSALGINSTSRFQPEFKILYESDGILGNIKIVEHSAAWYGQPNKIGRGLVVNNTLQTFMDIQNPENTSIWAWSNIIPTAMSIYPRQTTKVLLCGLGGGTIVKQMEKLGFQYDIVELDKRVEVLAKKYFYMNPSTTVIIDDARHFIKTTDKKYDIVIFDTFLSESAPEHLLTKEALIDVQKVLKKGGMLMSNFYGFTSGSKGYAARSVISTFESAGFATGVIATPGQEENRNLLIFGSDQALDFSKANYSETGSLSIGNLNAFMLPIKSLNLDDSEVLTDDHPKLGKLYLEAALSWKKAYNEFYTKGLYLPNNN